MNTVSAEEDDSGPGPLGKVQPRQLIVTVYGLYARDTDGWMSVASLIQLLADLGVEAPTVRSCVSRLKRAGLLEARTVSGAALLPDLARDRADAARRRSAHLRRPAGHRRRGLGTGRLLGARVRTRQAAHPAHPAHPARLRFGVRRCVDRTGACARRGGVHAGQTRPALVRRPLPGRLPVGRMGATAANSPRRSAPGGTPPGCNGCTSNSSPRTARWPSGSRTLRG